MTTDAAPHGVLLRSGLERMPDLVDGFVRSTPRSIANPEVAEYERDMARIKSRELRNRDKIGEFLGATYYVQNMSFPFIRHLGMPVSVSRWYPQKSVAIDTFNYVDESTKREAKFKRESFKKIGARYGYLGIDDEVAKLVEQIGFGG